MGLHRAGLPEVHATQDLQRGSSSPPLIAPSTPRSMALSASQGQKTKTIVTRFAAVSSAGPSLHLQQVAAPSPNYSASRVSHPVQGRRHPVRHDTLHSRRRYACAAHGVPGALLAPMRLSASYSPPPV